MDHYDFLIVGAGLFGATAARLLTDLGKRCLVIDRRSHIAGNVHTQPIADIMVHQYGAHIFHTNNDMVWEFVNRFATFHNYINSPIAHYKGEIYNLPFNMNTFHQLWKVVTPAQALEKLTEERAKCFTKHPNNLEEQAKNLVGIELFEKLIQGYTEKQWGRPCRELPPSIINRIPLRLTYDNNYFDARYQGIPTEGYTKMVHKMLDGIEVRLNVDYLREKQRFQGSFERCIYTGAIDEYFNYELGTLAYRSLRFETELLTNTSNFQGVAVVNHTDHDTPYTRIIEHKHFTGEVTDTTVITREYSTEWTADAEPYYPILDSKNLALLEQYKEKARLLPDVIFGGRLGSYQYYDMDVVVGKALALINQMKQGE